MIHQVRIFLLSGQTVDILCAKFALEGRQYVARDGESPIDSSVLAIFGQDRVAGYLLVGPQHEMAQEIKRIHEEPAK